MSPTIVSFGGGVNSAAMLVGLHERGERPDAILFADTGGEKPHTYDFVQLMDVWLLHHDFPEITTVQNDGIYKTLENNCLTKKMLPSLAYGFKSCSDKYKKRPQEKWAKDWWPAKQAWEKGEKVTKLIGIDISEAHRASIESDEQYDYRYPLIEWEWDRGDCLKALKRAGLPNPGKSACFFCPASKKSEIRDLSRRYPDLFARAVEMERNAELTEVKGLGRSYSWEKFIAADSHQQDLFPEAMEIACMCFDGEVV